MMDRNELNRILALLEMDNMTRDVAIDRILALAIEPMQEYIKGEIVEVITTGGWEKMEFKETIHVVKRGGWKTSSIQIPFSSIRKVQEPTEQTDFEKAWDKAGWTKNGEREIIGKALFEAGQKTGSE